MKVYKCEECGNLFEDGEQARWTEAHGEAWGCCPICKGGYEEAEPCKICGTYQHNSDEEYCEDCKKDVKKRFAEFIEREFSKEERELLNELYDGETI